MADKNEWKKKSVNIPLTQTYDPYSFVKWLTPTTHPL